MATGDIITVEQASALYKRQRPGKRATSLIGATRLKEAIDSGELAGRKVGHGYLTTARAVEDWILGLRNHPTNPS